MKLNKINHKENSRKQVTVKTPNKMPDSELIQILYDLYFNVTLKENKRKLTALRKLYGEERINRLYNKAQKLPRPDGSSLFGDFKF